MSERSKGDVSARVNNNQNPNATRVVKNPLLSASVTGLSFDDFPNKPQLLPAAPPVVHAPPPAPAPALIAGILNREPKTLVTVGQPSSIDDSEALDEINLNTSSEDSLGLSGSSPYRGAGPDPNANPLLEPPPGVGNDSLLSQAASSFNALPLVASNVFSSFSKRIYAAGSREQSEEPRLDIQPAYIQQANYAPPPAAVAPVPAPFYAGPPPAADEVVAPEPPKLYAPTEIPSSNPGAPAPPPTAGNPNSYRFTARKKLYAPIPGFSEQQAAQAPQIPQPLPFQTPPYPTQPTPVAAPSPAAFDISAQPAPTPVEERKSGGGLFSLTSLVPQGVLQNISGLVQSVTGNQEPVNNQPSSSGGYFDVSTGGQQAPPTNFFGGPTPAPPPASNYFTPGGAPPAPESVAPPPVGGFFAPPISVPAPIESNPLPPGAPPSGPVGLFTPGEAPQAVGQIFNPAPSSSGPSTNPIPGPPPTTAAGFFNPGLAPATVATPPLAPPSAGPPPSLPPASVPENFFTPGLVPAVAPTATPPPAVAGFLPPNPSPLPTGPPVAAAAPPPAAGQASYRLQKGTRLYKSPLTAQETAAPSGYSAPLAPTAAPTAIFNPFGAPAPGVNPVADNSQGVALFPPSAAVGAPPPSATNPPPSVGLTSVPLFAAPPTSSGIPFFNPQPSAEIKQDVPPAQVIEEAPQPPVLQLLAPPVPDQELSSAVNAPPPSIVPTVGLTSVPLFAAPPASSSAIPFFNPQPTSTPQPPVQELFAPPVSAPGQNPCIFAPPSSVAYPPPAAAPPASSSATSFFNPQPTVETSSAQVIEGPPLQDQPSTQGIPFFAPPPPATSGVALFTPQPTQELGAEKDQGLALFAQPPSQPKLEAPQETTNSVSLFSAAPPVDNPLFTPQGVPSFAPGVIEPVIEDSPPAPQPESSASLFAPVSEPDRGAAEAQAEVSFNQAPPLFVPVPAPADQSPGVPLYPPVASAASSAAPFAPDLISKCAPDLVASSLVPPATADVLLSAPNPVASSASLFAPTIPTESQSDIGPPPVVEPPTAPPAIGFFGAPEATTASLFTGSSGTQTVFSPLAQTITTPQIQDAGQDLVPPPIGFFSPQTEGEVVAQPPPAPSPLQSFFGAPTAGASATEEFNFFANPAPGVFPDLPVQQGIAPPPLAQEPPPAESGATPAASLGFDNLLNQSQQAPQQTPNSIENSYPNSSANTFEFFGGAGAPPPTSAVDSSIAALPVTAAVDPGNFFDQVPPEQEQPGNEDQRIQNFFNNPPLQDQPAAPGELKYDIVHSGLAVKELAPRSQTPVSNLVEPPSSACSEFSTLAPARQTGDDLIQQHLGELPEEILKQLRMATASGSNDKGQASATPSVAIPYTPALVHWFYKRSVDSKFIWTPFSHYDSALLETSLNSDDSTLIVPVEGGRYDVNIKERSKTPVYWEGKAIEVRRCSWFYKGVDSKYVPYTEDTAALLESEYQRSAETGEWHQKIMLANGEQVVFHGPTVIVHFLPQQNGDTWGASTQGSMRPRVVKRDLDDFTIDQGESQRVDHLLFMVHGIGSACDLKMRPVEEVVDDFRIIAQQLVQSHYKNSTDMGLVGRVEVLPISWHSHLHSEELGIDEKLKSITLESIPRLRNFTNDTLLDVLFYTSPKYCQKIMNTVADALNEVYLKYRMRHPEFNGGVSLSGHSLGSLILFDLLCHQEPLKESEEENKNPDQLPLKAQKVQLPNNDLLPKEVSYAMGPAGTGQPVINYTQLIFHPKKFFALGSPIGMFVTIRGIDKLGLDFSLPTCPGFYNIFHPFDPVAYRIEALVNPDMNGIRPVLIPHHKGRKRMHLELKETMTRVGADIKQRFMDTFKTTLDSVNFLTAVTKVKKEAEESLEKEKQKGSTQSLQKQAEDQDDNSVASTSYKLRTRSDSNSTTASDPEFVELDFPLGKLNDSKRVDYVLQEAPLEFINEYIFALSSHVCYWGSEDTILFVMKEIYASLGISTDSQVPQSSMTIERPVSHESGINQALLPIQIIQRFFHMCNSNLVNGIIKVRSLVSSCSE
ncbi:proline-rich protein 36 isoform X2 [Drosophila bipectinata]|uniref:proline-rich protein 36 isoform X2 n=1 Tax=Drosophila bipectinata TaxID=42026 RepID=UPI0038B2E6B6